MIKSTILLSISLLFSFIVSAQDQLVTKKQDTIDCRIISVTQTFIEYRIMTKGKEKRKSIASSKVFSYDWPRKDAEVASGSTVVEKDKRSDIQKAGSLFSASGRILKTGGVLLLLGPVISGLSIFASGGVSLPFYIGSGMTLVGIIDIISGGSRLSKAGEILESM